MGCVQVMLYTGPKGVTLMEAAAGVGSMVKLATVEQPPLDMTVALYGPGKMPPEEDVCVGLFIPAGTGCQVIEYPGATLGVKLRFRLKAFTVLVQVVLVKVTLVVG